MTLIGRIKLLYFQKSIYYSKNNDLKVNLLCWEWIYLDCGVIILPGRLFFSYLLPFFKVNYYIYVSTNSVYKLLPTIKCAYIFHSPEIWKSRTSSFAQKHTQRSGSHLFVMSQGALTPLEEVATPQAAVGGTAVFLSLSKHVECLTVQTEG